MNKLLRSYVKFWGGTPFWKVWTDYLDSQIMSGSIIADIGGGAGKLAHHLAPKARYFFILDKEETSRYGADNVQYTGSLARVLKNRRYSNIMPVKGDALLLPFTSKSLDVIISAELLEHLQDEDKSAFFKECHRVLKPDGTLIISTPNADYFEGHTFWLPEIARQLIPQRLRSRLPDLLRGAWLEKTIDEWEEKAGHYDHGCRLNTLRSMAHAKGFQEAKQKFLHTGLTSVWLQLMFTFPLLYLIAIPLIRFFYFLESRSHLKNGIGLMISFSRL